MWEYTPAIVLGRLACILLESNFARALALR